VCDAQSGFQHRRRELLEFIADVPRPTFDLPRRLMHRAIARLGCSRRIDQAIDDIAWANDHPDHECTFFWHANMDALWRFGRLYPESLCEKVHWQMTGHQYAITHGQTENHKIMIAVAGYLAAQAWPDWEAAADVMARTRAYLEAFLHASPASGKASSIRRPIACCTSTHWPRSTISPTTRRCAARPS